MNLMRMNLRTKEKRLPSHYDNNEGMGMEELRQEVVRKLGKARVVPNAMSALDERSACAV